MNCLNIFFGKICGVKTKLIFSVIFVYVMLVDFILPPLKLLPRTGLILDSFSYLNKNFKFAQMSIIVLVAILIIMFVAFFILYYLRGALIRFNESFPEFLTGLKVFEFFTPFLLIIFAGIYLGGNTFSELLFLFIFSFGLYVAELNKSFRNRNEAYILASKGLGIDERKMRKSVLWKNILPGIRDDIGKIYLKIWFYFLIYEFIFKLDYIGSLMRSIVKYADIAGFYAAAIFLWIVISLGYFSVTRFARHYIFWDEE